MIVNVSFGSVKSFPSIIVVSELTGSFDFSVIDRIGEFRFIKLVDDRVVYFNNEAKFEVWVFMVMTGSEIVFDELVEFVKLLKDSGRVFVNCPSDFELDDLKLRFESVKLYSEGLVNLSAGESDVLNIIEVRIIVNNLLLMEVFGCAGVDDDFIQEFNRLLRKGSFEFLSV